MSDDIERLVAAAKQTNDVLESDSLGERLSVIDSLCELVVKLRGERDWHREQEAGLRDDVPNLERERDEALAVIDWVAARLSRDSEDVYDDEHVQDSLRVLRTVDTSALDAVRSDARMDFADELTRLGVHTLDVHQIRKAAAHVG